MFALVQNGAAAPPMSQRTCCELHPFCAGGHAPFAALPAGKAKITNTASVCREGSASRNHFGTDRIATPVRVEVACEAAEVV